MTDNRYPFVAIAGQNSVKNALIYNLIEPRIGGVLLCGQKGTAKSTMVRALADLTHQKVIDLPLNITEDMLVGTIDFERAVKEGIRVFSGGVLQRAHENILYVDEVNLLPDGIINTLICAAASGENLVHREGISHRHDCRFVLVGTMNPEEGKLRPQFLDRFGLYVDVVGEQDEKIRAQIIHRRLEYEMNSAAFCTKWYAKSEQLRKRILKARSIVANIVIDKSVYHLASRYAIQANTEGNRCEIVLVRTAAAVAAWNGRDYITAEDMKEAAIYALPHRSRQEPQKNEVPPQYTQQQEDKTQQSDSSDNGQSKSAEDKSTHDSRSSPQFEERDDCDGQEFEMPPPKLNDNPPPEDEVIEGKDFSMLSLMPAIPRDKIFRQGSGRRSKTKSSANKGRYAAFTPRRSPRHRDLVLDATLRAAAPYQSLRNHTECAVALTKNDLRFKIRENHVGATIVFVVDASGSMGAQKRMKAAKEAILSMLLDSYQKRDRIGMIAFRKDKAEILLHITSSVDLAQKKLQQLPTGGRTPLAAGIFQAWQLLKARKLKDPEMLPILVLVTDGRANSSLWSDDPVADAIKAAELVRQEGIHSVVIDTEKDFISLHIARQIANVMNATYYQVDDLKSEHLQIIVKHRTAMVGFER